MRGVATGVSLPCGERCRSEGPHRENWPALLTWVALGHLHDESRLNNHAQPVVGALEGQVGGAQHVFAGVHQEHPAGADSGRGRPEF